MWFTGRRGLDGNVFFLLWPDLSKCVRVVARREIYFERMMKRGIKRVKGKDQRDKILISFCTGLLSLTFCRVKRLNLTSIFCFSICPPLLSPHHLSSSISSNIDFLPISALIFFCALSTAPSLLAICLFLFLSFSFLF